MVRGDEEASLIDGLFCRSREGRDQDAVLEGHNVVVPWAISDEYTDCLVGLAFNYLPPIDTVDLSRFLAAVLRVTDCEIRRVVAREKARQRENLQTPSLQ